AFNGSDNNDIVKVFARKQAFNAIGIHAAQRDFVTAGNCRNEIIGGGILQSDQRIEIMEWQTDTNAIMAIILRIIDVDGNDPAINGRGVSRRIRAYGSHRSSYSIDDGIARQVLEVHKTAVDHLIVMGIAPENIINGMLPVVIIGIRNVGVSMLV